MVVKIIVQKNSTKKKKEKVYIIADQSNLKMVILYKFIFLQEKKRTKTKRFYQLYVRLSSCVQFHSSQIFFVSYYSSFCNRFPSLVFSFHYFLLSIPVTSRDSVIPSVSQNNYSPQTLRIPQEIVIYFLRYTTFKVQFCNHQNIFCNFTRNLFNLH